MLATLIAVAMLSQSPEATAPASARPLIVASTPSRTISARAPTLPDGPTRVVCTRERSMDSNIQRRVCRRVPVNSSERERMASDMLKDMQRLGRIEGD
ncbi:MULTISPECIES: hypothetical protein [unclassified Brevundimonas]|uniref:hypothetical protein n=1 Tax=unclassified Brevundimonas TaxID=2622653 RepID=UPI0025C4BF73|nr:MULTISPECIES: hypothetical protein [unclassified Brevundimonas]